MWFRWGLKSWFYSIIIFWIIFIGVNLATHLGDFRYHFECSGFIQSAPCSFFEFITNFMHWIAIIIFSFSIAIIAGIIGKIKSNKVE